MAAEPLVPDTHTTLARQEPRSLLSRKSIGRFGALRTKTLVLLIMTGLGLFLALYIPLRWLVLGSYLDLEAQTTRTEVARARDALQNAINRLSNSAAGYATWDDTYAFVQDHNSDYMVSNLADPSFPAEDINLAIIVDTGGTVVGAKAYDLRQHKSANVPPLFLQPDVLKSHLFMQTNIDGSNTGLVLLPEGPMLVAARPILTSDKNGPIRGVMLMGRYLDDSLIQRLSNATHLSLSFFKHNDALLPAAAQNLEAEAVITEPISEQTVIGLTALTDVFGKPAVVLRVEVPRTIYAQGNTTVNYFTLAMIVVALAGLAVSLIGLDRMVLMRLASLDKRALAIGMSGDLSLRMEVDGNDELTRLSQSINGMLESIEQIELKRRDAEEVRAHAQEDLLRAREQFSQMLVHDLKNPLTSIRGFVDILKRTPLNEDQHELTDGIIRGTTHLVDLVTEILDVARLSEGRLELRRKDVDINSLLEACAIELQPWAAMDRTSISVIRARQLPLISIDTSLMRRVLANLISNAIKHTPSGTKITISAQVTDTNMQIAIRDTGLGIPHEVQARLFERFAIINNTERRQNSTGLGLAFCKLAVEAHGGTIQVESAPNVGTTFTILLPLNISSLVAVEDQAAEAQAA